MSVGHGLHRLAVSLVALAALGCSSGSSPAEPPTQTSRFGVSLVQVIPSCGSEVTGRAGFYFRSFGTEPYLVHVLFLDELGEPIGGFGDGVPLRGGGSAEGRILRRAGSGDERIVSHAVELWATTESPSNPLICGPDPYFAMPNCVLAREQMECVLTWVPN